MSLKKEKKLAKLSYKAMVHNVELTYFFFTFGPSTVHESKKLLTSKKFLVRFNDLSHKLFHTTHSHARTHTHAKRVKGSPPAQFRN